jgi:hypothetical protein
MQDAPPAGLLPPPAHAFLPLDPVVRRWFPYLESLLQRTLPPVPERPLSHGRISFGSISFGQPPPAGFRADSPRRDPPMDGIADGPGHAPNSGAEACPPQYLGSPQEEGTAVRPVNEAENAPKRRRKRLPGRLRKRPPGRQRGSCTPVPVQASGTDARDASRVPSVSGVSMVGAKGESVANQTRGDVPVVSNPLQAHGAAGLEIVALSLGGHGRGSESSDSLQGPPFPYNPSDMSTIAVRAFLPPCPPHVPLA